MKFVVHTIWTVLTWSRKSNSFHLTYNDCTCVVVDTRPRSLAACTGFRTEQAARTAGCSLKRPVTCDQGMITIMCCSHRYSEQQICRKPPTILKRSCHEAGEALSAAPQLDVSTHGVCNGRPTDAQRLLMRIAMCRHAIHDGQLQLPRQARVAVLAAAGKCGAGYAAAPNLAAG
jgi:hypothetical protein